MNRLILSLMIATQLRCSPKESPQSESETQEDTGIEDTNSTDSADPIDTANPNDTDSSLDTQDTSTPEDTGIIEDTAVITPDCYSYHSSEEDYAPIQTTGSPLPSTALQMSWEMPTDYTSYANFSGTTGDPANHEGIDYIHSDSTSSTVSIYAASAGTVVYVRTGCPQDSVFSFNYALRECGSGWGNHIVIDHGSGIFSRYAHLSPSSNTVLVGDMVSKGDLIAQMGNTGRSDLRHLHFELGAKNTPFDPCDISQSLDLVYDPSVIPSLHP